MSSFSPIPTTTAAPSASLVVNTPSRTKHMVPTASVTRGTTV